MKCLVRHLFSVSCAGLILSLAQAGARDKDLINPWLPSQDAAYTSNFQQVFGQPSSSYATIDEYLEAHNYDRYLGTSLTTAISQMNSGARAVMWGMDYWLISMVDAYYATGRQYYLSELVRGTRAVLAYRDDNRGVTLYNGMTAPVWGTDIYSQGNGRRYYFGHTGMATYPMLELLYLAPRHPQIMTALGADYAGWKAEITESLDFHNRDWTDGPGADEGHYFNHPQSEHRPQYQNIPTPANLQSAMGRALWMSWKATGNTAHRDKAIKLARYLKRRITLATDTAYYWEYELPLNPVTVTRAKQDIASEDTSHGYLTLAFPIMMATDHQVFDSEDMRRFARTFTQGVSRLNQGIMAGEVNGSPLRFDTTTEIASAVSGIFGFAPLNRWDRTVYPRVADFYLKYRTHWDNHIDLAALMRNKPRETASEDTWLYQ
jgi:hypothetical protein